MKSRYATTKDLQEATRHMRKEKLSLDARVEIYLKGNDKRYGIVGISHFHVIPNLILEIEKSEP